MRPDGKESEKSLFIFEENSNNKNNETIKELYTLYE
jgi:hypothetical protein